MDFPHMGLQYYHDINSLIILNHFGAWPFKVEYFYFVLMATNVIRLFISKSTVLFNLKYKLPDECWNYKYPTRKLETISIFCPELWKNLHMREKYVILFQLNTVHRYLAKCTVLN